MDAKEKGCELYQNVCNHKSLADELAEEAADKAEEKEVEDAVKAFTDSGNPDKEVEEQVRAAVEDAKKPLE